MDDSAEARGQYRGRETDDGDIEIYDADNDDAWIISDTTMHRAWNA
ncbi:hypothetical protein SAMN06269185_0443 [Natronoarchaeum philippinense]|uniref:Uncharacterized protein n=1 Tax=Natronoarchaeum philippinense TaxID=558529 RepID=A0A285N432_NATPI|nr:hypothetical protein [Natronoarchaeum philippinense]SNZ04078.1 hypothetical protein SAMN06269185_0443 [Natronoarchaeum philippinense]